jgi:hypothetical protein
LNFQRLAVAHNREFGDVADPQERQPVPQKRRVAHWPVSDFRHDVTGFQAGAGPRRSFAVR